jgi:hypothetical protein
LTTDPIVSHPSFGQSWNPYSYVLNNPLAFTDPSGFQEAPPPTVTVSRDGNTTMWGPPTAEQVEAAKAAQAAQERADADAAREWYVPLPPDMAATGTTAGPTSQPTVDGTPSGMAARVNQTRHHSPGGFDPSFGKSRTEIIVELGRGAGDGTADLAADAAKIDLLHVPRGVARLAQTAWESEWGLTGLATVVLGPVRQQIEAAADDAATGDFRGAAAAGVKAVTVAVSTGITIGELGAATVNAIEEARPVRNGHLAGQTHPVTGAPFDADGFPDFKAAGVVRAEVKITYTGSRSSDFFAANKAAGFDGTPKGMTWHHHQDGTTMQLVPQDYHGKTGHTGGFSLKKE